MNEQYSVIDRPSSSLRLSRSILKRHVFWIVVGGLLAGLTTANSGIAQVVPDRTLGIEQSIVTPSSLSFTVITGGATRGTNLFHSFDQFSIPTGNTTYFNNALPIQTIISRITGSSVSNIDGTIRANGNATVLILNPNGIVFGRNARLNVGGSFLASTANSVNFADGTEFSARATSTPPLLTISAPIGLSFTGNPSRIVVQGNGQGNRRVNAPAIDTNEALRVPVDRTLALIGGDLILEGATLKTAGGRIELGSVADAGVVRLSAVPRGFSLSYEGVTNFGNIQLTRAAAIDASGNRGGDIQVRGRQITLQGGSQIESSTLRTAAGGSLQVIASDLVEVSGSTADNPQDNRRFPSSLSTDNRQDGQIPGTLTISTRQLVVRNGARISASTLNAGVGGNLTVNATDSVELVGTGLSSGGLRSSGLSVQTRGTGTAGSLTVNTQRLLIQSGAEVSASTFGIGNGGNVTVNASDITVTGTAPNQALRSRLSAEVGNPGEITSQQGQVSQTPATGKGGDLTLTTQQLRISDGAIVAVSSRTDAIGAQGAGEINVTAQKIELDNGGAIVAQSRTGQGGNLRLKVRDLLLLRHNSQISTTAGTAQQGGNGGNITIQTPFIIAVPAENSDITANAFTGRGGNVQISAQSLFGIQPRPRVTALSDITASSEFGFSGSIVINTPDVDPSRGLVALPGAIVDASNQIAQGCSAGGGDSAGRFAITGRGGLPANPEQPLSGEAVWEDTRLTPAARAPTSTGEQRPIADRKTAIGPATSWVFNGKGEVTLIAQTTNSMPASVRASCQRDH